MQRWGWVKLARTLIFFCGWLSACSQAIYYRVRAGDTLSELAVRYGVSTEEIARYNAIPDPDKLYIGQMLRIPPGEPKQVATATKSTLPPSSRSTSRRWRGDRTPFRSTSRLWQGDRKPFLEPRRDSGPSFFKWPVDGQLTSGFGPRNGSFHDGIDIAAPLGTPVLAAADGKVIFSDVLRGYGNVVIVRHRGGYLTVYAHHRTNLVKEGQSVRQGDVIAEVGQTGRATGPSLHFEVRKDNLARNPLRYLPREQRTVRAQ